MKGRLPLAKILLALLLLTGLAPAAGLVGAQTPLLALFSSDESGLLPVPVTDNPLALRARAAGLNLANVDLVQRALAAGQPPSALSLGLFSDTHFVAHFNRAESGFNGGYSLSGVLADLPGSEIHLSVTQGAFFASIHTGQGLYRISAPDGRHTQIFQLNPAAFPLEEDLLPTAPVVPAVPQAVAAAGPSQVDDGTRIDVYVGYTTAAKNAAGGQAAMLSLINTAISETNTGYANSGVQQRVVLVGADEYAYDETNFNWNLTLSRWQDAADSLFAPAHTQRELVQADEMLLLVADASYCGLGYLMTTPSSGFAANAFVLVAQNCATGYYSFAHELGHTMGAHHNRENADGPGAYAYAYGYWINNPVTSQYDWRTIMAYPLPAGTTYPSLRVNHWSNPTVLYNDQPTGLDVSNPASAYNAQVLNQTAPYVAQFRDGAAPAAPSDLRITPVAGSGAQLDWAYSGSDLWQFRIEQASAGLEDWVEIAHVPAEQRSYAGVEAAAGQRFRVLADNGNGRTASALVTCLCSAPSGLTVTPLAAYSARLEWSSPAVLADALVVKRAPAGTAAWTQMATLAAAAVSYTDAAVPDGLAYQYQVESRYGSSLYPSNPAELMALPAAPLVLSLTGLNSATVQLDWSLTPGTPESLAIERRPISGVFAVVGSVPANALSYTDTSLPAGGDYQYRVVARNARGELASPLVTLPAAPSGLHPVYPGAANTIQLAWNDNSAVETGYQLEVSSTGGATWALRASPGLGAGTYQDSTGSCNQTLHYRLRALAAGSQSAPVTTSGITPPCQPLLSASAGTRTVLLRWPEVGSGVSYYVYVWTGLSFDVLTPTGLPAQPTSYFINRLLPYNQYVFQVKAVNAAGNAVSNALSVTTLKQDTLFPLIVR